MDKLKKLEEIIKKYKKFAIAFSGGVDSTFLLYFAHEILKDNVTAITVNSPAFSKEEIKEADEFCKKQGIYHIKVDISLEELDGFSENTVNRCYNCKKSIFTILQKTACRNGISIVADGTNADDTYDYRPGIKALEEMGIVSPLREAYLTKEEIRKALKDRGLSVWNKPAYACLATRIPYGEEITLERLERIGIIEEELHRLGFLQVRVRDHGNVARIEVLPEDREKFFSIDLMNKVNKIALDNGFKYAALDLAGYKMGNLNIDIKNYNIVTHR
ncbi:ATP-dependent sacrificial sulfur transferase LarE [Anaerovorax odorimutans]|uniref:ATP-dependent sacrificial sulfur transferase LarE n=1 Tax=Anaerovorax odorimutans TaxID=109327 RepID=UPI0004187F41|nr:ATP-dependent sacrificial sulfur transferase LarE [Anaerovorax odorimutans]